MPRRYLNSCPLCAAVLTNSLQPEDITYEQGKVSRSLQALGELDRPKHLGLVPTDVKKYQHCEVCGTDYTANYFHTITSGRD